MTNLLQCLEVDKSLFWTIVNRKFSKREKPTILTFIMPSMTLFDVFRLIKLSQFNKAGFKIILVIEESQDPKVNSDFMKILNKFIPSNKFIFLFNDLARNLINEKEYLDLLLNYKIERVKSNTGKKIDEISLLDLNRFISQYFILKHSKELLNVELDFFLSTFKKDLIFLTIPNFNEKGIPIRISLKDFFIDWNFDERLRKLEIKIHKEKISKKQIKSIKNAFSPIEDILQCKIYSKQKDFFEIIAKIKKYLKKEPKIKEYFVDKSNYEEILFVIDNPIRRKIISIIVENKQIKAEEIRKKINHDSKRKYCLANIIKHLNLLVKTKIIVKTKKEYEINISGIIFNIPLSWFKEE
jgi:hypothetical protein